MWTTTDKAMFVMQINIRKLLPLYLSELIVHNYNTILLLASKETGRRLIINY